MSYIVWLPLPAIFVHKRGTSPIVKHPSESVLPPIQNTFPLSPVYPLTLIGTL